MKKILRIVIFAAISVLFSVASIIPIAANAESVDNQPLYDSVAAGIKEKLKNANAELIFGKVTENHYQNRTFDLAASLDDNWLMYDAYLRASKAEKQISDLLDEVDAGSNSAMGLSAMNIGLTDELSKYEMLNVEILNSFAKYGKSMDIEEYLSIMKQSLPTEILEFRQEKYLFAGKDYYSLLFTFSEDAPIRFERVVFTKAEDYIAQVQMMASDADEIEKTLINFISLHDEEMAGEKAEGEYVSEETTDLSTNPNDVKDRELSNPDYSVYEPFVEECLNKTDRPENSFGMLIDIDGDGIEELIILYPVRGAYHYRIVSSTGRQSSALSRRESVTEPADQMMIGSGMFEGQQVVVVCFWRINADGITKEYQVLDADTLELVKEMKSRVFFTGVGAILIPHGEYYIGFDQVSEDRYLEIVQSIELSKALYSSPAMSPDYRKQQFLSDILYCSAQDSTDKKEAAQLEILYNRVVANVYGDNPPSDCSGLDFSNFEGLQSALENIFAEFFSGIGYDPITDYSVLDYSSMIKGGEVYDDPYSLYAWA